MAQTVKNLPAMQETCVRSLGGEDALEKGMATHSSILAWEIPLTKEPGGPYSQWGHEEPDMTEQLLLTHAQVHKNWWQFPKTCFHDLLLRQIFHDYF